MNEQTLLSTTVQIQEPCTHCEKTGVIYDPRCTRCGERFTIKQLNIIPLDVRYLPCNHHFKNLEEYQNCSHCGGTGVLGKRVALIELAALLSQAAKINLCQNCKATAVPDGNPLCPACRSIEDDALSLSRAETYEGDY